MTGDVLSLWGDVMSTPLGDITSGDAMSLHPFHSVKFLRDETTKTRMFKMVTNEINK